MYILFSIKRIDLFHIIEYYEEHRLKWSTIYDIMMLVMIVLSIIPLMFRKQTAFFLWFDWISVAVFILDYMLRWVTADLKHSGRQGDFVCGVPTDSNGYPRFAIHSTIARNIWSFAKGSAYSAIAKDTPIV